MSSKARLWFGIVSRAGKRYSMPHRASASSSWEQTNARKSIVVAPSSLRATLNLPAMRCAGPAIRGSTEPARSARSAMAERTDIRCDLPVP